MSLPVILRREAEVDIQDSRDQLEAVRVGLGNHVIARVREVLTRIEAMPELHGKVWEDVRAADRRRSASVENPRGRGIPMWLLLGEVPHIWQAAEVLVERPDRGAVLSGRCQDDAVSHGQ